MEESKEDLKKVNDDQLK